MLHPFLPCGTSNKMVERTIDVPKRQQRLLDGARELTNHSPLNCSQRLNLVIVDTTCQVCNAETSAPRICGGCYGRFYCCKACQRNDWQRHRQLRLIMAIRTWTAEIAHPVNKHALLRDTLRLEIQATSRFLEPVWLKAFKVNCFQTT